MRGMVMRYDIGFLNGFEGGLGIRSDGDDVTLTLKKGDVFQRWMTDETPLHGGETVCVKNRRSLHALIDAWLDGVEFEG
jgi:hypothetical protein